MTRAVRWLAVTGLLSLFPAPPAFAQPDRIAGTIDQGRMIALKGSIHLKAQPQDDLGLAEPSLQLGYVSMLFKPSPDRQAALERLLVEQRDPSSPDRGLAALAGPYRRRGSSRPQLDRFQRRSRAHRRRFSLRDSSLPGAGRRALCAGH
jgi:hypothetical protein